LLSTNNLVFTDFWSIHCDLHWTLQKITAKTVFIDWLSFC